MPRDPTITDEMVEAAARHLPDAVEWSEIVAALEAAAPMIAAAARRKALTEAAYIVSAFGGEQSGAIREAIMNARDKE